MVQLDRKQQLVILVLVSIIIFGAGYRLAQVKERAIEENKAAFERGEAAGGNETSREVLIHVAGSVEKPGVYELPSGSRIIDALNKACPTAEANLDVLKLAAQVTDGQTIYVPVKTAGQAESFKSTNSSAAAYQSGAGYNTQPGGGKVNINTADMAQLDTLPGIGEAYAQRIIQFREINGPFKSIEDIKLVSGIGDKRFEQLKDLITVQ